MGTRHVLHMLVAAATAAVAFTFPNQAAAATGPLLFGAEVRPSQSNMEGLERDVGRPFDVTRVFYRWNETFPDTYATWLKSTNHEMMISVKSMNRDGSIVRWADVSAAQPGSAIYTNMVRWATAMKNLGVPVFFTFNHEPEADASRNMGTATEYVAAWRKFVNVFRAEGVTNAKFLWILTAQAYRLPSTDRRFAAKWYPGDEYVDGIASDAYNWYTCRTNVSSPWRSLAWLIEGHRAFGAAHPGEDLYIAEWGSTEDPNMPGRKAQWITDAQALFKQPAYAQFRGVSYFNIPGQGNCVWDVRSSNSALSAFSAMAHDPYYGG